MHRFKSEFTIAGMKRDYNCPMKKASGRTRLIFKGLKENHVHKDLREIKAILVECKFGQVGRNMKQQTTGK